MKKLVLLFLAGAYLLGSCKDSEQEEVAISWQVDHIEMYDKMTDKTSSVSAIEYDESGRLVRFGNDYYTYDDQGRLSNLKVYHAQDIYLDHDCFYDEKGRMTEVRWTNKESNMSSLFAVSRKDRKFFYEGNAIYPAVVEQPYYTRFLFPDALIPSEIESQRSEYVYQQGNVAQATYIVKGNSGSGPWSPGAPQEMTVTLKNTFVFDTHENVYRKLFGQLGYIPLLFTLPLGIDDSFLYSKNNVVKANNDKNAEMSLLYKYDNQQRVVEIEGGLSIVKIYYK